MFDVNDDYELVKKAIYYNPDADIVFFGEAACMSSISLFFQRQDIAIPRVAVQMSGALGVCCGWDMQGGSALVDILHGSGTGKGCQGLEEVIFIVASTLWSMDGGTVPTNAVLRPAVTQGITTGQHKISKALEERIALIKAGDVPDAVEKGWVGDKIPMFRFMSLSDPEKIASADSCDAVPVTHSSAKKLECGKGEKFVKDLQRSTSCEITVADRSFPGQDPREIGFVGTPDAVEKAKAGILRFLASCSVPYFKFTY